MKYALLLYLVCLLCINASQPLCGQGYLGQNFSMAVLSDSINHMIYTYDLTTNVTTSVAGTFGTSGYVDGVNSVLNQPCKAVLTPDGSAIVWADSLNMVIRKVDLATRSTSTVAGTFYTYVYGVTPVELTALDGVGNAASFYRPEYIQFSSDGMQFYVSTEYFQTVRAVTYPGFATSTLFQTGLWGSTDGILGAGGLLAGGACTLSVDGTFWIISDRIYRNIRRVDVASLQVDTIAGPRGGASNPGCEDGLDARFHEPVGQVLTSHYAFVVDRVGLSIRRIDLATWEVSTFAGFCETAGTMDAIGTDARFEWPTDIAMQGAYLYVSDMTRIRKIDSTTALVSTIKPATEPSIKSVYFVYIDLRMGTRCTLCPQNHFCPAGVSIPCPYPTITLGMGCGSYLSCQCPPGTFGQVTGPNASNCVPCPVGKFCNAVASSCMC